MLEFPEEYFDQEVREGFYIDSTMKTVWAAEMELLQAVAEVCDRHGLKWYAAYGTLLGAIRHEGFVPWDDDMDIWMKRADYNVLMKVLPKELPEGFRVQSPMTDEGYEQFHCCVCTGNAVTVSPNWLERFHGCPFVVGLDIFPLDYLPRDEDECEVVKLMIEMVGRGAQVAKELGRGTYEGEAIENAKKEVGECVQYMTEDYHIPVNHELLENEEWIKLSSELWKWANVIAMMYGEEESDYLVEFLDYIRCDFKKYPKAWFEDGYCASYEGYMIPIPAGYDELLHTIYDEYWRGVRQAGQHDYPYYKQEMDQLYNYVDGLQKKADNAGISCNLMRDMSTDLPAQWEPLVLRPDGTRKKLILGANDPMQFATEGMRALDRLEETLDYFAAHRDEVTLWWRPHKVMKKLLDQVSPELGTRYQRILDDYRAAGWGICDESDNVNRAVEQCDAYYGNMNAILQPFQNAGKPILLMCEDKKKAKENNEEQKEWVDMYFSFTDFAETDDRIIFSNNNFNALTIVDKASRTVEQMIPFPGEEITTKIIHLRCAKADDKILFLPTGNGALHVYDRTSGKLDAISMPQTQNGTRSTTENGWYYFEIETGLYLLPRCLEQGLWKWNTGKETIERENWWNCRLETTEQLVHDKIDDHRFCTLLSQTGQLLITDVLDKTVKELKMPDERITNMSCDGSNIWYTVGNSANLKSWSLDTGETITYEFPENVYYDLVGKSRYMSVHCVGEKVFLVQQDSKELYLLDKAVQSFVPVHSIEISKRSFGFHRNPQYALKDGKMLYMTRNTGDLLKVDIESLEAEQIHEDFDLSEQAMDYLDYVLLKRYPLMYEEKNRYTLDRMCKLLQMEWD